MTAVFSTTKLDPFGIEVDFDLSIPLDEDGAAALRALIYREKLLVFRNQRLGEDDQLRVVGHFGNTLSAQEDNREMSLENEIGHRPYAWHADVVFHPEPYRILSLFAIEIDPSGGTATRFVSGIRAAESLPADLRRKLDGLTANTVMPLSVSERDLPFELPAFVPQVRRPAIIPHPVTGEPVLFVFELQTSRIEGLPQAESEALLTELFAQMYREDAVHAHVWQPGDFVMWDNIALQHARVDQTGVRRRRFRRVVAAEKSFFELFPSLNADPEFAAWVADNVQYQRRNLRARLRSAATE